MKQECKCSCHDIGSRAIIAQCHNPQKICSKCFQPHFQEQKQEEWESELKKEYLDWTCIEKEYESTENEQSDWWLGKCKSLLTSQREQIVEEIEKIDVSGGGSGRRLKEQIINYLKNK